MHPQEATPTAVNADQSLLDVPAARSVPLLGSLPLLVREPFDFLERSAESCGDLFTVDLGLTKLVVAADPAAAQHIFQTNAANYSKGGPLWTMVRKLLGNGLVVSEGEIWQRQRRMMQPEFHMKRLAMLTDQMVDAIDDALRWWEEDATAGRPIDLVQAFNQVTMRVIVRALFGSNLSRSEMDRVGEAMGHALDYMVRGMAFDALPDIIPLPGRRRFNQSIKVFDETVYRLIGEARNGRGGDDNLLAMLMATVDDETGAQMTDSQLRDEIATLFLAGYETTSIALTWAQTQLCEYPAVARRLDSEIQAVLDDRKPSFSDIGALRYTRQVLDETLRLFPSAWFVPRTAINDDVIGNYRIPAGSNVAVLIYLIHRHPEHWNQPERFAPERFGSTESVGQHPYAYLPFGAGRRLCIGRSFALMEGPLVLAMVRQRFDLRFEVSNPRPMLSTTFRPRGKLPVILTRR